MSILYRPKSLNSQITVEKPVLHKESWAAKLVMRMRKRPAYDSPSLVDVAREGLGTKRIYVWDHSPVQLQQRGFVLSKLTDVASSDLLVAAGALQSRLQLCGQLPAEQAPPGYRAFAHKQRLEYEIVRPVHPSSTIAHHVSQQVSFPMHRNTDAACVRRRAPYVCCD